MLLLGYLLAALVIGIISSALTARALKIPLCWPEIVIDGLLGLVFFVLTGLALMSMAMTDLDREFPRHEWIAHFGWIPLAVAAMSPSISLQLLRYRSASRKATHQ